MNNKYKTTLALLISAVIINTSTTGLTTPQLVYKSQAASSAPKYCSKTVRFTKDGALKPGTSSKKSTLKTIPKGKVITVKMESPAWYKLTYRGKTGWVLKNCTTPVATGDKCSIKIKTKSNVNLRLDTSSDTDSLAVIPKGTSLTAIAKTPSWYKVKHYGKIGWIFRNCTEGGDPVVTTGTKCSIPIRTTSNVKLRAQASTDSTHLTTINKGTPLTAIAKTTAWYKVEHGGKTGWIYASCAERYSVPKADETIAGHVLSGHTGKTTSEVNLRQKNSASSTSLGLIKKGQKLNLIKDSIYSHWYLVEFSDSAGKHRGWVSKQYIKVLTPESAARNQKLSPSLVKLQPPRDVFDPTKDPELDKGEIYKIIEDNADKLKVDPKLFKAVVETESSFNHTCISGKGAVGFIQLMPDTAIDVGLTVDSKVDMRWDPYLNINAGMRYIHKLYLNMIDEFGDYRKTDPENGDKLNWDRALAAYNAGPASVRKYGGEIPPYEETQNYVKLINKRKLKY